MAKVYDPILCMMVERGTRTGDRRIRSMDFAGFVLKKKNGYELGVNSNHVLYIAFPGETMNNPHMYIGKDDPTNRSKAEQLFDKFASLKKSPRDSDNAIEKGVMTSDAVIDLSRVARDFDNEYGNFENLKSQFTSELTKLKGIDPEKEYEKVMQIERNYISRLVKEMNDITREYEAVRKMIKADCSDVRQYLFKKFKEKSGK